MKLTRLSDVQLLESVKSLVAQGRVVLARLLAHLVEVEERRLHLEAACPSMLQFCVRRLGMSEGQRVKGESEGLGDQTRRRRRRSRARACTPHAQRELSVGEVHDQAL